MKFSPSVSAVFDGAPYPADCIDVTQAQACAISDCLRLGGAVAIDAGGVPRPAYPQAALPALKDQRRAVIDAARDLALQTSAVTYGGNSFQADPDSIARLTSATLAAASGLQLPAGFAWRTADNRNVAFVQADLVALGAAMLIATNAIWQKSWSLKAAIDAAPDAPALFSITW